MTETPKIETCPDCDGDGGDLEAGSWVCETCNGKGTLEVKKMTTERDWRKEIEFAISGDFPPSELKALESLADRMADEIDRLKTKIRSLDELIVEKNKEIDDNRSWYKMSEDANHKLASKIVKLKKERDDYKSKWKDAVKEGIDRSNQISDARFTIEDIENAYFSDDIKDDCFECGGTSFDDLKRELLKARESE